MLVGSLQRDFAGKPWLELQLTVSTPRVQVVQEIKVLRASVSARERERAERATLKEQEKLTKAKVGTLWIPANLHSTARQSPTTAEPL